MRKRLIAGNWKLNKTKKETLEFTSTLCPELKKNSLTDEVEVMVIPSFTSIETAVNCKKESGSGLMVGAQDISQYASGAYTGEVNAEMLKELEIDAVLVGHSERREVFQENNDVIAAKLKTALDASIKTILCCGEPESVREAGTTDEFVAGQIESALAPIKEMTNLDQMLVIAYEPIWAIGTGKTCDAAEADRVINMIRSKVKEILGDVSEKIRILYGGSVKPENIEEIINKNDIDGALVGGASLKNDAFLQLITKSASNADSLVA